MSMFVAGGAVAGGRVQADWPGLTSRDLLDRGAGEYKRDLRPTLDLRAVVAGLLHEHLGLDRKTVTASVFPGSDSIEPLEGLIQS